MRKPQNYTDNELISMIKSGRTRNVLESIYLRASPKVKQYIYKNNGDEDEANDIFQEAFMTFHKYVLTGKFKEEHSIDGFIFSIARNLWINYAKRRNRSTSLEDGHLNTSHTEPSIHDNYVTEEQEQRTHEVFGRVGERCKELLINIFYYNLSMKSICEVMGFENTNTAKTANYKCKQKLLKLIEKEPGLIKVLRGHE